MRNPDPSLVSPSDPGESGGPARAEEVWAVLRHLAFACGELAGEPGLNVDDRARYRDGEAAFRSLADLARPRRDGDAPGPDSPAVAVGPGAVVRLTDLLAHAWGRHGKPVPGRAIDREMIDAARQLLAELSWRVPPREP